MSKDFKEVMAERSDKQLAEILTTKRHEYQTQAIAAAQEEFDKRQLDVNTLLSSAEIESAITAQAPVPKEEQTLNGLQKFLTFALPGPVTAVWTFMCMLLPEPQIIKGFSLPVAVLVQFFIYDNLKKQGYTMLALEFKKWSLNSWIFFVALFILVFVFEAVLARMS